MRAGIISPRCCVATYAAYNEGMAKGTTVAVLLKRLGGISPERVRLRPPPGMASEEDLIAIDHHEGGILELVDGTLVEIAYGFKESMVSVVLANRLGDFVMPRQLGVITGATAPLRLAKGLVRAPNVAFTTWEQMGGELPKEPIANLAPELIAEILKPGNTKAEMSRKRDEYFTAGVCLVWFIDPESRTVAVYNSPDNFTTLTETQMLDGGEVLPGFSVLIRDLFTVLEQQ